MKKFIFSIIMLFITAITIGQEKVDQLPNQFRDFVDHQQRWNNVERPQIQRMNGKVIITMTESQFKRMQDLRKRRAMMVRQNQRPICQKCEKRHKRHHRMRGHL